MNIWLIAGAILALKSVISHTWRFCVSPNIIGSNKCSSSNTCIFFTVNISKAVQPPLAIHIAHGEVLYLLLFDGEGQPLPYLTCTSTLGIEQYFRLHYKMLLAMYQTENVWFMNNVSVYLISYTTLAPHFLPSHWPTTHPHTKQKRSH